MAGRRFAAEVALVAAAFLFGSTFPLVHDALRDVTPFGYLTLRFVVAVLALGPFALHLARRPAADRRRLLRVGVIAGVLLFGGYATQTVGLRDTSPATSAFLTGLYVLFVPFVEAAWLRRPPPLRIVVSALAALVGLFLLTGADLALGWGEWLTVACAVLFAIWIVYQGAHVGRVDPVPFTAMQMATLVVISVPVTAATGIGRLTGFAWFAIVFTGIACSAVALSLQLWGQRRIPPARAAVILLLEPVFAGIVGWCTGETLGAVEIVGAAVILAAIGYAELGRRPGG